MPSMAKKSPCGQDTVWVTQKKSHYESRLLIFEVLTSCLETLCVFPTCVRPSQDSTSYLLTRLTPFLIALVISSLRERLASRKLSLFSLPGLECLCSCLTSKRMWVEFTFKPVGTNFQNKTKDTCSGFSGSERETRGTGSENLNLLLVCMKTRVDPVSGGLWSLS